MPRSAARTGRKGRHCLVLREPCSERTAQSLSSEDPSLMEKWSILEDPHSGATQLWLEHPGLREAYPKLRVA